MITATLSPFNKCLKNNLFEMLWVDTGVCVGNCVQTFNTDNHPIEEIIHTSIFTYKFIMSIFGNTFLKVPCIRYGKM